MNYNFGIPQFRIKKMITIYHFNGWNSHAEKDGREKRCLTKITLEMRELFTSLLYEVISYDVLFLILLFMCIG